MEEDGHAVGSLDLLQAHSKRIIESTEQITNSNL